MRGFKIDETTGDDSVALALAGDLDMSATFALEPVIDRVMAARPREFVRDLGDVAFIDSSGLGLLISTSARAGRAGVEMAITGASPEIQRVFQLAGLDGFLPVRS